MIFDKQNIIFPDDYNKDVFGDVITLEIGSSIILKIEEGPF